MLGLWQCVVHLSTNPVVADLHGMLVWNDDGITVIDVTNLADPRYCFIGQDNNDHMQSAYEYLALYYPLHDIAKTPPYNYLTLPPGVALAEVDDCACSHRSREF